tara:strand:+ start:529 stop:1326 length:798 start_codon:yes stop_codon:yes gene_type:complete
MKRLAFLLFGHMRSYKFTHASFNSILDNLKEKYECDTFVHTWDCLEPQTVTWHEGYLKTSHELVDKSEITSLYNPTDILVETQTIKNPNKTIFHNQCEEGVLYSQYSRYMVNELKKQYEKINKFKYDVVVVSRPDIIYYENLIDSELEDTESLWLCKVFLGSASDILCFSGSENIDKLCDFYNHFSSTSQEGATNLESVFQNYLNTLNLNKKTSKYCMPRDWKITRSWWGEDKNPSPGTKDHRIWDKSTGTKEINENDAYSHFRK